METSGALRRRFAAMGHDVISCDMLPSEDALLTPSTHNRVGRHIVGDVFATLDALRAAGWWPDLAIFHPTCTLHTVSAAWAFSDPDFDRYPGVGYHQRVLPGTLVGGARRAARELAEQDIEKIKTLPVARKAMENPRGTIPNRTTLGAPQQVIQPYEFGDDASKATCLWLWNLPELETRPEMRVAGRLVEWPRGSGKMVERWGNQTDSGQNNVPPGADRWKDRSRTYPGPADAMAKAWG